MKTLVAACLLVVCASADAAYTFTDLGVGNLGILTNDRAVPRYIIAGVPTGGGWGAGNILSLPPQNGLTLTGVSANADGLIAGVSQAPGEGNEPMLWDNGVITPLPTLFGQGGGALAINDSGQVVGASAVSMFISGQFVTSGFATRWEGGVATNLGSLEELGSVAQAINNAGQIVGGSVTENSPYPHDAEITAVLWDNGAITDLNSVLDQDAKASGWFLAVAWGISDDGSIVGLAFNGSSEGHTFLLSPVPEPSIAALLALGLCWFGWQRRTRLSAVG